MADIEIPIDAGTSKRLLTAGKYCDKNILVTASGGTASPVIEPLEITTNGTYTAPEGVDGYSPVTVNVSGGGSSGGEPYEEIKNQFLNSEYHYDLGDPEDYNDYSISVDITSSYSYIGFAISNDSIGFVPMFITNGISTSISDILLGTGYISLTMFNNHIDFVYSMPIKTSIYIITDGQINVVAGTTENYFISDTEALNIITGGEQV